MSVLKSYYCCNCLDEIKEVLFTCDVCDQFDLCLQVNWNFDFDMH